MKKLIFVSVCICVLTSLSLSAAKSSEVFNYQKTYRIGAQALENKDYSKAFEYMQKASKLGHKQAQYSLALLYIDGQGTKEDYAQAYLWLNVASEANVKKWRQLRDTIHNALSAEQQASLQPHVISYIEKYGSKAQDVTCAVRSRTRSHNKEVDCTKNLDLGSRYL